MEYKKAIILKWEKYLLFEILHDIWVMQQYTCQFKFCIIVNKYMHFIASLFFFKSLFIKWTEIIYNKRIILIIIVYLLTSTCVCFLLFWSSIYNSIDILNPQDELKLILKLELSIVSIVSMKDSPFVVLVKSVIFVIGKIIVKFE